MQYTTIDHSSGPNTTIADFLEEDFEPTVRIMGEAFGQLVRLEATMDEEDCVYLLYTFAKEA